uniref:cytochrome b n=1 Tax=Dermatobranchus otome TaxID=1504997 RepID=UPI001FF40268|nr:cytochrome b [Dermatobranchus otome]UOD76586.1 cytochrome b [Dermatobranchus otome]UOD76599.1 cytochrome b [Dermatobranchus otome]
MYKVRQMNPMESLTGLPSPMGFSIWWNGGSILGMLLGVQILTGLFLSMHYTADMTNTFASVIHIIRDTPGGWFFRNIHANGASLFFVFLYLHIGRGLYYQSYITQPRTWMVGVTIYIVSMAVAFFGYVLPWGQMSFWGATVITNLASAVPYIGPNIVEWVWGGFSVGQATLNRFFSLHFILPFLVGGLSGLHILFLHEKGSTNPLGETNHVSKIPFHPYFTWKDFVGFLVVLTALVILGFFYPFILGDPENFSEASPMVTPVHIQPEWYFLFAYAILRCIPNKLGGVVALVFSFGILYFLPLSASGKLVPASFTPPYQVIFWSLFVVFVILTWLGACPIEEPYETLAVPMTVFYFSLYLLLIMAPSLWAKFISTK